MSEGMQELYQVMLLPWRVRVMDCSSFSSSSVSVRGRCAMEDGRDMMTV